MPLLNHGNVTLAGQTARFTRPAVLEEYSVSMDGVRQDFVVLERPKDPGELAVRLAVSGAKIEQAAGGAQLVLENSGRKIAYSRLRVSDATGKELSARMEVMGSDGESQRDSIAQPSNGVGLSTGIHGILEFWSLVSVCVAWRALS